MGAATVAALLLALVSSGGVQAAPVSAAPSVAAACKIKSYTPSTVTVGASVVKKTFAVQTTDCTADGWVVVVFPYSSDLDKGITATEDSPSISFPPKTFTNADAGKHPNGALVAVAAGAQLNTTFSLLRRATWGTTLNASPEPVRKGKKITIKATLKRVSWTQKTAKKMPYVAYPKQSLVLQFRASGTSTYKDVKTVKTGTGGKVSTTVTAARTGTWRFRFAGTSTTGSATSSGDSVSVN
jgi:hypothetical protein